ncbi:MAG: hypothetical protein ACR2MM_10545 [Flavobacteriaceae bacterium]
MKTILKFTTATAFMFATVAGMATETNRINAFPYSDTELEILETADKGKPIFRRKGDKVFLNMLNLQSKKVMVKVYDSNGRLLFKETFNDDLTIEKVFNFEKAFEDRYTVIVKDSDNTYSENIFID